MANEKVMKCTNCYCTVNSKPSTKITMCPECGAVVHFPIVPKERMQ